MTNPDDLAARLYSPAPQPASAPAAPVADPTPQQPKAGPQEAAQDDPAARLYDGSGAGVDSSAYHDAALGSAFGALEVDARSDGDAETAQALAEGRRAAAELLAELAVPMPDAKGLAIAFAQYAREPMSDEALAVHGQRAEQSLRAEWGADYASNLAAARAAYRHAASHLPWLPTLVQSGAGNDPRVLKVFAGIGRRLGGRRP